MGARGNSGVILSQIVRGASGALAESDDLPRAFRSASDAAYRAVKKPVEGTMLTAIRELAEAAERGLPTRRRSSPPATTSSRGRATCSKYCARPASSMPAQPGSSRSCAASRPSSAAKRCREAPVHEQGARPRGDPPGAFALPLLHGVRGRGRRARSRRARERPGAARRLAARRRRRERDQGARAHRRPGSCAVARRRARRRRRRRDREHARAGARARGAPAAHRAPRTGVRRRSSRSLRAPAIGRSFRVPAPSSSTAARR